MLIGLDARVLYRPLRGIGKYLFNILENMVKLDSSVEFKLFYEEITGQKTIPVSAQIKEVSFLAKGYRFHSWEQFVLPGKIKKSRITLFHSPANTAPLIQLCPTVVTVHDTILMESEEEGDRFYNRFILPIALKNAKKIITISQNSKKDIIRLLKIPENKIEVIYHGINSAFRRIVDGQGFASLRDKYGIRERFIFTLGAVGKRKNIETLLEVFAQLKKSNLIKHQLVITGIQEAGINEFLRKIKALGLQNEVIITTYVPEDDLVALYNHTDLFLYLSLYEGFGFPVLEAMTCGAPVIASSVSSIPELVQDAGILVDPRNTDEIGEAILAILNNKNLREELSEKGFKQVKKFSWEKAARQTLDVYKQMAGDIK